MRGACSVHLVDQNLDLSTIATALGRHRIDGVVDVQKPEAALYEAVSEDPDRADRLLHRDVAAVPGGLEHAKRHEAIVTGDEVRGLDTPDVEQLEDGVEVLPETGMTGVGGTTFRRREGRPVFAVLVKKRQTALDVLGGEALEEAADDGAVLADFIWQPGEGLIYPLEHARFQEATSV